MSLMRNLLSPVCTPYTEPGIRNRPPFFLSSAHGLPVPIWSISDPELYGVMTPTVLMPEFTRFESEKSMSLYLPQKGSEASVLSFVRPRNPFPEYVAEISPMVLISSSFLYRQLGFAEYFDVAVFTADIFPVVYLRAFVDYGSCYVAVASDERVRKDYGVLHHCSLINYRA